MSALVFLCHTQYESACADMAWITLKSFNKTRLDSEKAGRCQNAYA
jgi:hypothetical protein